MSEGSDRRRRIGREKAGWGGGGRAGRGGAWWDGVKDLLRHPAGEERDARHGGRHSALQACDGGCCNCSVGGSSGRTLA